MALFYARSDQVYRDYIIRPTDLEQIVIRALEKATGIGLYLCKKLCDKLDIGIYAQSLDQQYTEITLVFPVNSYLTKS